MPKPNIINKSEYVKFVMCPTKARKYAFEHIDPVDNSVRKSNGGPLL